MITFEVTGIASRNRMRCPHADRLGRRGFDEPVTRWRCAPRCVSNRCAAGTPTPRPSACWICSARGSGGLRPSAASSGSTPTAMVPGFGSHRGRAAAAVQLRLRGDRVEVPARVAGRDHSLQFLSADQFHPGTSGFSVQQIPWDREGRLRHAGGRLAGPDGCFPGAGFVRLRHDTVAALVTKVRARTARPRQRRGSRPGVRSRGGAVTAWESARAVADAVLYEGYLLYPIARPRTAIGPAGSSACWVRWRGRRGLGEDDRMSAQFLTRDATTLDPDGAVCSCSTAACERRPPGGGYVPVAELVTATGSLLAWDEAVECELHCGPVDPLPKERACFRSRWPPASTSRTSTAGAWYGNADRSTVNWRCRWTDPPVQRITVTLRNTGPPAISRRRRDGAVDDRHASDRFHRRSFRLAAGAARRRGATTRPAANSTAASRCWPARRNAKTCC